MINKKASNVGGFFMHIYFLTIFSRKLNYAR